MSKIQPFSGRVLDMSTNRLQKRTSAAKPTYRGEFFSCVAKFATTDHEFLHISLFRFRGLMYCPLLLPMAAVPSFSWGFHGSPSMTDAWGADRRMSSKVCTTRKGGEAETFTAEWRRYNKIKTDVTRYIFCTPQTPLPALNLPSSSSSPKPLNRPFKMVPHLVRSTANHSRCTAIGGTTTAFMVVIGHCSYVLCSFVVRHTFCELCVHEKKCMYGSLSYLYIPAFLTSITSKGSTPSQITARCSNF